MEENVIFGPVMHFAVSRNTIRDRSLVRCWETGGETQLQEAEDDFVRYATEDAHQKEPDSQQDDNERRIWPGT